jgi:predicted RNase H-like nuclease (RuvC/YqgF family)
LDIEIIVQKFDEIEKKVESLIEASKTLEAANAELKSSNIRLEQRLHELQESEQRNEEVKSLIRDKIDSLVGRLNGITKI